MTVGSHYLAVTFLFNCLLHTWYSIFAVFMLWELCTLA